MIRAAASPRATRLQPPVRVARLHVREMVARLRALLFAAPLLAVAGCGSYFTSSAPVTQTYVLRAAAAQPAMEAATQPDTAAASIALRVSRPVAGPGLETDRILLTRDGRELDFYAGGRWAAPIPDVLGSLAIETLRGRPGIATVYGEGTPFPSDYVLHIVVRRFDAAYEGAAAPIAHVVLDCTLGRRLDRTVIDTFVIDAQDAASANRLDDVVQAYEGAARAALEQLATRASEALDRDSAAFSATR